MRNAANKIHLEHSSNEVYSYTVQSFSEEELERAGRIFDKIKALKSPQKEQELVRLVLAQDRNFRRIRH